MSAVPPTLLLLGATPPVEERLRGLLAAIGTVHAAPLETPEVLELVRNKLPCTVLLSLEAHADAALQLCRQLARLKGCSPMVVSTSRDVDLVLRAMRAGAKEFALLEADGGDVVRAAQALSQQWLARRPTAELRMALGLGAVVVLLGAKGGAGSTTLAVNLAGALREAPGAIPPSVVVLDLDLQMGDVLAFLDLSPTPPLSAFLDEAQRPNRTALLPAIPVHASGVCALGRGEETSLAGPPDPSEITEVVRWLQQHFQYVIVDGLRDLGELALATLECATLILPVLTPDLPAVKSASRCLAGLRQLGYPETKLKVVMNRYQAGTAIATQEVAEALAHQVDATVTNDFVTVIRTINAGQLLVNTAPEAEVTRDLRRLAETVAASPTLRPALVLASEATTSGA